MTILFKFRRDRHYGIKRDPGSLDQRVGEQGLSDESESKVKSQPSDSWREIDVQEAFQGTKLHGS
jgi:hypothetical protein